MRSRLVVLLLRKAFDWGLLFERYIIIILLRESPANDIAIDIIDYSIVSNNWGYLLANKLVNASFFQK